MALVLKDRVQETTAVVGTGSATLLGPIAGYQSFANSTPDGSIVYYTIAGTGTTTNEWEVGYATFDLGSNSLIRDNANVYASSNASSIVNFSAGTKNVFVTLPAEQAIYQETNGDLRLVGGVIGLSIDGTQGNTLPDTSFQAFTTGNYYMQANQQNLSSGNAASADWVVTADNGTDTTNYMDMGMASSGYNFPEYSAQQPNTGYVISTGSELKLVAGKYGANVAAANAASTDIVFTAGDLLVSGERARIKGGSGNIILSNTPNPTDTGEKLQVTGNVAITGNTSITGAVYSAANITANNQLATKAYVDTAATSGIVIHTPVRLEQGSPLTATYNNGSSGVGANLTNSGTQVTLVVDGVTANVADRILVYGQANAVQNGIYVVTDTGSNSTNWILTRSSDANTYGLANSNALGAGSYVYVTSGNTGAGESYVCTTQGTITFGVTPIVFTQFSGATAYTGTAPINVSGQTISLGGVVDATHGGTGLSTYSTGDMIYANAGNSLTNLTVGSAGQTLIVSGSAPTWGALDLAGVGVSGTLTPNHGGTGLASYTVGDMLYANTTSALAKVAPNQTTTKKALTQTGDGATAGVPTWDTISSGDITGLGTMATQNANAVAITGGTINNVSLSNVIYSGLGTMSVQNANNVAISGGVLNNTSIGAITASTGAFTDLSASGTLYATNNIITTSYTGFLYGNNSSVITASTTIPNTAITGLGTMSTQNANSVAITGGTINNVAFSNVTYSGLGTMATQNANNVTITGGSLNNVTVGLVTPLAAAFTNVTATGVFIGSGASISNLNASNVSSGVLSPSYGGTGLTSPGASGNVLTSNGTAWTSAAPVSTGALAAGNNSIVINNVNITANATINAGQNGFSVGPVNTANGVVVTVSAGQSWVVI